ncbi:hypothetical protein GCK32_011089, partial [Trichostrongylus colubriformis]
MDEKTVMNMYSAEVTRTMMKNDTTVTFIFELRAQTIPSSYGRFHLGSTHNCGISSANSKIPGYVTSGDAKSKKMSEVAERYVEQIQTTAETLRRRIVAYYDGIFFLGNKLITAADRARDIAEPVAYDVKDY